MSTQQKDSKPDFPLTRENYILLIIGFLIIAMTVHEFAHGWVAYRLGDNTAKFS